MKGGGKVDKEESMGRREKRQEGEDEGEEKGTRRGRGEK